MMMTKTALFLLPLTTAVTQAFVITPPTTSTMTKSTTTQLFLEKDIADMVDKEYYRQKHKKEFDQAWMKQNRQAMLHSYHQHSTPEVEEDYMHHLMNNFMDDHEDMASMRQYHKDRILAQQSPQKYCVDRCLATGHCDAFEDIFEFSPAEVLQFCQECVLSDDEEPCDLPPSFYKDDDNGVTTTTAKP